MAREAVICEPLRTPVGRFGGVFRDLDAAVLASTVIREIVNRTNQVCTIFVAVAAPPA